MTQISAPRMSLVFYPTLLEAVMCFRQLTSTADEDVPAKHREGIASGRLSGSALLGIEGIAAKAVRASSAGKKGSAVGRSTEDRTLLWLTGESTAEAMQLGSLASSSGPDQASVSDSLASGQALMLCALPKSSTAPGLRPDIALLMKPAIPQL